MVFRLGSIPVRIRLWFFLVTLMLGGQREPKLAALWIAIVFVSVLVHELGHALMGRRFGLLPQIELHGMGGTTSWLETIEPGKDRIKIGPARSIAISLAGPFAGFAFGGVILLVSRLGWVPSHELGQQAFRWLVWVNIGWGLVNLVPMLPLDGGNVMRAALDGLTKGRGEKAARIVSIVFALMLLAFAAFSKQLWFGFLGALFVYNNVQAYRAVDQRKIDIPAVEAINAAYIALDAQDGAEAIRLLRPALAEPRLNVELRQIALRLFAYALLIEGEWTELMPLLDRERLTIGPTELARYARTAKELGRDDEATRIEALEKSAATFAT